MGTLMKTAAWAALLMGVVAAGSREAAAACHGKSYGYRPIAYSQPIYVQPRYVQPTGVRTVIAQSAPTAPVAVRPAPRAPMRAAELQLMGVRFVDPGIPQRNLGPRYRIVLRNNAPAIRRPFDLILAAGIDGQMQPELPRVSEHVAAMTPGQVLAIDIRLPIESLAMAYPGEDKPAPFSTLFVMVAGQQDLLGNVKLSQLAVLPRIGLPMVDLTLIKPDNTTVPSGATVTLGGEGFGLAPGKVILALPGLELVTEIVNWGPLGVQVKLPRLALAAPTQGKLVVIRGDGANGSPLPIQMVPSVPAAPAAVALPAGGPPTLTPQGEEGLEGPGIENAGELEAQQPSARPLQGPVQLGPLGAPQPSGQAGPSGEEFSFPLGATQAP